MRMTIEFGSRSTLGSMTYPYILSVVTGYDWSAMAARPLPRCLEAEGVFALEPSLWGASCYVAHGRWCDTQGFDRCIKLLSSNGWTLSPVESIEGKVGRITHRYVRSYATPPVELSLVVAP